MVEVLIAFAMGFLLPAVLLIFQGLAYERDRQSWVIERTALTDRVQSPDLPAYYGARAAYHPEDFPAQPEQEFAYDDFGYVREEIREGDGRLPGEMPPDAL